MAAFLKKLRHPPPDCAATEHEDDPIEDRADEHEIHYTNAESTLVFRMSLPALNLDTVLTFEVGTDANLQRVQDHIDFMFDTITTELAEEIGEECPGANAQQFRSFIESAASKMDEWQMRLKKADESIFRAERLKAELVRMREAYHKDLMNLRQQLSNAAKKDNDNGFDLDVVMNFDARRFMQEEQQTIADLQAELHQQAKSNSRAMRGLENDLTALKSVIATKDLLAERQALLIETMQKEHGAMSEQMAVQLQEAMSAKEAEYSARSAELKAALESKHCVKCRSRIEKDCPPSFERESDRKSNCIDDAESFAHLGSRPSSAAADPTRMTSRQSSQAANRRIDPQGGEPAEHDAGEDESEKRDAILTARGRKRSVRRRGVVAFLGAQELQDALACGEVPGPSPGRRIFGRPHQNITSSTAQTELCSELLDKAETLLREEEAEGVELQQRSSVAAGSEHSGNSENKMDDYDEANNSPKTKPSLILDMLTALEVIKKCKMQPEKQQEERPDKSQRHRPVGIVKTVGDLAELTEPPSPQGGGDSRRIARRPVPTLSLKTGKLQSVWELQSDQKANDGECAANMHVLPAFKGGSKKTSAKPVPSQGIAPVKSGPRRCSLVLPRSQSPDQCAPWPGHPPPMPTPATSFESTSATLRTTSFPSHRDASAICPAGLRGLARAQQEDDVASVVSLEDAPVSHSGSMDSSMLLPSLHKGESPRPPVTMRSLKGDMLARIRKMQEERDRSRGA
eukprot:TRINITY_DN26650_c0_g1_i1.p1 TRINITY_DN26650_c0_g1~~TRINITY_DN26650_c0_g1_i1.p1  ORF type:complete len:743 (+),score=160.27 TRINITY_DN26650_c0_g1_i1:102-2330(+)